ncbi:Smr/MutS family protein [Robertkochia aurantiaca]|uniref:Smr/MutS family protein n=1 Tax=Robertkochia aurantiaca TaxID=2873700 RepID=UPI001CCA56F6|nr:Smr/MutS family protein [Robertkochia sp. 3YJGBD-33]
MGFKPGTYVSLIDEAISGKVVRIADGQLEIETEEGFLIRVSPDEVIAEEGSLEVTNIEAFRAFKEKNKHRPKPKRSVKQDRSAPPMEVDLHIDKLTESTRGMEKIDMLNLQIDTAKRKLEFAIASNIRRVVFIHGVGEGVLRQELEYLFGRYDNVSYYDADYRKYGMGATEVYVHQNPK